MISRVRSVTNDSAGTFESDNDITDWLNEAQRDLSHRLPLVQAETTGTWAGTSLALPATLTDIISFRLVDDDVQFVDNADWWTNYDDEGDPDPSIGRVFNGAIEVYPTPAAGTAYALRYYKEPADLSAGADVSTLPLELHMRMVRYAQAMAKLKEGDIGMHREYMAMYEGSGRMQLPKSDLGRARIQPGPITIQMEAGPFDRIDSRHI